jgi:hypothetical protein
MTFPSSEDTTRNRLESALTIEGDRVKEALEGQALRASAPLSRPLRPEEQQRGSPTSVRPKGTAHAVHSERDERNGAALSGRHQARRTGPACRINPPNGDSRNFKRTLRVCQTAPRSGHFVLTAAVSEARRGRASRRSLCSPSCLGERRAGRRAAGWTTSAKRGATAAWCPPRVPENARTALGHRSLSANFAVQRC